MALLVKFKESFDAENTKQLDYEVLEKEVYSKSQLKAILKSDIEIKKLISDDLLVMQKQNKNARPNNFASILAKETIYGDVIVLSPSEFQ